MRISFFFAILSVVIFSGTISMAHAQEDNASQFTDSNSNFSASITTNSFHEGLACDGFDTVLLIQDNIPWSTLNDPFGANVEELRAQGIDFCLTASSQIGVLNLNQFGEIIISSAQNQRFYNTLFPSGTIHPALSAWVEQGGILSANLYDDASGPGQGGNWDGDTFVAGVQHVDSLFNFNNIDDATHPIITGEFGGINGGTIVDVSSRNDLDNWGLSSNGYFVNLPAGTTVILNQPDVTGDGIREPVMIQYPFGDGEVIASLTSTEWRYVGGFNDRPVNKKLLANEIGFQNEIAVITVPDLELVDVSPVQAIFNPDVLVDSKKTLLRIEITSDAQSPLNNVPIELNIDGTIINEILSTPVNPGSNVFFLPSNQFILPTGSEFTATVDVVLPSSVLERDPTNNSQTINYVVKNTNPFRVLYVPVQLTGQEEFSSCDKGNMLSFAEGSSRYIKGTFPIADNEFVGDISCNSVEPFLKRSIGVEKLNADDLALIELSLFIQKWFATPSPYDVVVGVVPDNWFILFSENIFQIGDSLRPDAVEPTQNLAGFAKSVLVQDTYLSGKLTAHEITHLFNWVPEGDVFEDPFNPGHLVQDPVTGYWVEERKLMDNREGFMIPRISVDSDPLDPDNWIHPSTFNHLLSHMKTDPVDPLVLGISGAIFKNGTTILNPWYKFESIVDIPLDNEGKFTISYLDGNDQVLGQTGFDVSVPGILDSTDSAIQEETQLVGVFALRIPDIVGTEKFSIKNSTHVIAEKLVTSNPPQISIISPNSDDTFIIGDQITISWESSDIDGDELSYIVSISEDNGQSWIPLAVGLSTNEYTFEAPVNIISDSVLVRVTVSDGINTSEDVLTNALTLKPFPAGGQRSDVNDFIAFTAPLEKTTVLPSGTSDFKIIINYGETVDSATFEAILNGIDISSSFNPVPGTNETILLALGEGRNTLKVTIDGIRSDGRSATDRDSLGFNIG